jgi:hypothetical protein
MCLWTPATYAQSSSAGVASQPENVGPSFELLTAEGDTLLKIVTFGAILVGSGTATALLGAAAGAAGTQALCPALDCGSDQQSLDPIFPFGGALVGGLLSGAFGVYVAGAVATFFFSDDGQSPE